MRKGMWGLVLVLLLLLPSLTLLEVLTRSFQFGPVERGAVETETEPAVAAETQTQTGPTWRRKVKWDLRINVVIAVRAVGPPRGVVTASACVLVLVRYFDAGLLFGSRVDSITPL